MTTKILLPLQGILCVSILSMSLNGCMTAADHARQLGSQADREMTVGIVQKEIRKGMSQAEVAVALGSPNIVSRDKDGIETWIYDKIASEVSYSRGEINTGILGIIIGGSRQAGASAQTQKTLTVIIKFNEGVVNDFSYHSSKF
jgi:outer membrane protein assembly factor BamE (lipoprotein component of BamABCDE complex)